MTRLGFNEFADAVVAERWMQPVPLRTIAAEARLTVDEVLERVTALGLPPRKPPAQALSRLEYQPPPLPAQG